MKKRTRIMSMMALSAILVIALGTVAFAATGTGFDASAAIATGVAEVQTQAMSSIGAVAPVAIGICGAIVGVKVALRAFRSVIG